MEIYCKFYRRNCTWDEDVTASYDYSAWWPRMANCRMFQRLSHARHERKLVVSKACYDEDTWLPTVLSTDVNVSNAKATLSTWATRHDHGTWSVAKWCPKSRVLDRKASLVKNRKSYTWCKCEYERTMDAKTALAYYWQTHDYTLATALSPKRSLKPMLGLTTATTTHIIRPAPRKHSACWWHNFYFSSCTAKVEEGMPTGMRIQMRSQQ